MAKTFKKKMQVQMNIIIMMMILLTAADIYRTLDIYYDIQSRQKLYSECSSDSRSTDEEIKSESLNNMSKVLR